MKLTKNLFIMCLLAGDTESIGIVPSDYDQLCEDELRTSYTFRVAKGQEPAKPLPVVLMVGHVGWQVHVKLPLTATTDASGRKIFTMVPGKLQKGVSPFFKAAGILTGVGISKDLEEFCDLVQRLYGVNLLKKMQLPIELETIAHLASYNMTRTAVEATNWVCFGTILAKGKISKGDDSWDAPWDLLRVPGRSYLAGDISQPAGSATMLTYFCILRLFPDVSAVRQLSALDGPALVRWWEANVLRLANPANAKVPWTPTEETQSLWDQLTESTRNLCEICDLRPEWPAVTAGGPRFIHSVRADLINNLELLAKADSDAWPTVPPEAKHLVMFGRYRLLDSPVPTDATMTAGWAPNPGSVLLMVSAIPGQ